MKWRRSSRDWFAFYGRRLWIRSATFRNIETNLNVLVARGVRSSTLTTNTSNYVRSYAIIEKYVCRQISNSAAAAAAVDLPNTIYVIMCVELAHLLWFHSIFMNELHCCSFAQFATPVYFFFVHILSFSSAIHIGVRSYKARVQFGRYFTWMWIKLCDLFECSRSHLTAVVVAQRTPAPNRIRTHSIYLIQYFC